MLRSKKVLICNDEKNILLNNITMNLKISQFYLKNNIINLLLFLIPASFIAGNLIINLNILLLVVFSLILFRFDIFKINYNHLDKIIIGFFIYLLIVGVINSIENYDKDLDTNFKILIKSLSYLRYLFLYLIIRFLVEKDIINLKLFLISSSVCTLFVSLDLVYQLNFGVDIFGYERHISKLSGPFGDELIAGSYLQRFSIFVFFTIPFYFQLKNKISIYVMYPILFSLIFFSIIISGNRMPFLLFLFMLAAIFILEKKTRKYSTFFLIGSSVIFIIAYNYTLTVKGWYNYFVEKLFEFYKYLIATGQDIEIARTANTYIQEFDSGIQVWKVNKFFGGGIDSFYLNCSKIIERSCASHPHNYYLEILAELGVFGFILVSVIFAMVLFRTFYKKYFGNISFKHNILIIPFMYLFLAEIFPIKSSGSFFTTGNSAFIFLVMAILVSLSKKENLN